MFDLAFIDADKEGYLAYGQELLPRMRPGGLPLVGNAFWGGEVVGFAPAVPGPLALRLVLALHTGPDMFGGVILEAPQTGRVFSSTAY
jgi:hypothetical protein